MQQSFVQQSWLILFYSVTLDLINANNQVKQLTILNSQRNDSQNIESQKLRQAELLTLHKKSRIKSIRIQLLHNILKFLYRTFKSLESGIITWFLLTRNEIFLFVQFCIFYTWQSKLNLYCYLPTELKSTFNIRFQCKFIFYTIL